MWIHLEGSMLRGQALLYSDTHVCESVSCVEVTVDGGQCVTSCDSHASVFCEGVVMAVAVVLFGVQVWFSINMLMVNLSLSVSCQICSSTCPKLLPLYLSRLSSPHDLANNISNNFILAIFPLPHPGGCNAVSSRYL